MKKISKLSPNESPFSKICTLHTKSLTQLTQFSAVFESALRKNNIFQTTTSHDAFKETTDVLEKGVHKKHLWWSLKSRGVLGPINHL